MLTNNAGHSPSPKRASFGGISTFDDDDHADLACSDDIPEEQLPVNPRRLNCKYEPSAQVPIAVAGDSNIGMREVADSGAGVLQALVKIESDIHYLSLMQQKLTAELKDEFKRGLIDLQLSTSTPVQSRHVAPTSPTGSDFVRSPNTTARRRPFITADGGGAGAYNSNRSARDSDRYSLKDSTMSSEVADFSDEISRPPIKSAMREPSPAVGTDEARMTPCMTTNNDANFTFAARGKHSRAALSRSHLAAKTHGAMKEVSIQPSSPSRTMEAAKSVLRSPVSGLNVKRLRRHHCFKWWLPNPRIPLRRDGATRLILDVLSMVFLLYDSLSVPYLISWSGGSSALSTPILLLQVSSTLFWTVDMLLGFISCDRNNTETPLRQLALRYLKTWFIVDFAVVSIDWSGIFIDMMQSGDSGGAPPYLRLIRILKIGRMLRIMTAFGSGRFAHIYNALLHQAHRVGMETHCHFAVRILKIVVIILWLNHIGGCIFYMMVLGSKQFSDTGMSWRDELSALEGVQDVTTDFLPQGYLYLKSFYWSLTAMFAGESFLLPSNSTEAYFALMYIIFGMLFASSLISSLSAMLVDFQMLSRDTHEQQRKVQEFLFQMGVDTFLSTNITLQIMDRMAVRPTLGLEDVPALHLLSVELRQKLWQAIYGPLLSTNHFLRTLDYLDDRLLMDICFSGVSWQTARPGEEIFEPGVNVPYAYYIIEGAILYKIGVGGGVDNDQYGPKTWACEMTLWIAWETVGRMEATRATQIMMLQQDKFWKMLDDRPEVRLVCAEYATVYAGAIKKEKPPLSDLGSLIDHDNLVALMSMQSRQIMSFPSLTALKMSKNFLTSAAKMDRLQSELHSGACDLREDLGGRVVRVVRVAAVQITRSDGMCCLELGENGDEGFRPSLVLPGTKIRYAEYPMDAITRFLLDLNVEADRLNVTDRQISTEVKSSAQYGVDTKYVRTVFYADLPDDMAKQVEGTVVTAAFLSKNISKSKGLPAIGKVPTDGTADVDLNDVDVEIFEVRGGKKVYVWLHPFTMEWVQAQGHRESATKAAARWLAAFKGELPVGSSKGALTMPSMPPVPTIPSVPRLVNV